MRHFKIFVELTRINKPIGFMLLFWPCAWGLAYSYNFNRDNELFFYYIILFFCGIFRYYNKNSVKNTDQLVTIVQPNIKQKNKWILNP